MRLYVEGVEVNHLQNEPFWGELADTESFYSTVSWIRYRIPLNKSSSTKIQGQGASRYVPVEPESVSPKSWARNQKQEVRSRKKYLNIRIISFQKLFCCLSVDLFWNFPLSQLHLLIPNFDTLQLSVLTRNFGKVMG